MFCEAYNQSLSAVAANSEALSPALQQHLVSCTACRETFAEEQSLFAAIDAGLQITANSEIPATLIPRVRVALNNEPVPHRRGFSILAWGATGAAVTATIVFALVHSPSKQKPLPNESAPSVAITTTRNPPNQPALNSVRKGGVSPLQHTKRAVLVASQNAKPESPEVLVPPDEGAALVRYEESLRRKRVTILLASSKSVDVPQGIEPLRIPEMEFVDLKIPAISEGDSEGDTK